MKYSIGDYVIVLGKMNRLGSKYIKWAPFKFAKPQLCQISGLATRYDGNVEGGYYYDFEPDPNYFVPNKTHLFWQVKFGLLNKPIYVREEGMRLATIDEIEELPKLHINQRPYSEKDRKFLAEDSKNWPRDSKGRWIKV